MMSADRVNGWTAVGAELGMFGIKVRWPAVHQDRSATRPQTTRGRRAGVRQAHHQQSPLGQSLRREVLEIPGHDELSIDLDRGRQNVPVVRIGKVKRLDQGLITRHKAIANRPVY
jgi:hypothetical protein